MSTITPPIQLLIDEYGYEMVALAMFLTESEDPDKLRKVVEEMEENGTDSIRHGSLEYTVCDDDRADELQDEHLDNMLEDFVLSQIDEALACYFDCDSWKSDARMDGRGMHIAHYDHEENYQDLDGKTYYIYRTN